MVGFVVNFTFVYERHRYGASKLKLDEVEVILRVAVDSIFGQSKHAREHTAKYHFIAFLLLVKKGKVFTHCMICIH